MAEENKKYTCYMKVGIVVEFEDQGDYLDLQDQAVEKLESDIGCRVHDWQLLTADDPEEYEED